MLFRHDSNGVTFSLVVDDFGVKYTERAGAQHLIDTLLGCGYELSIDWDGAKYLGLTIEFASDRQSIAISLPGYIDKVLKQHAPYINTGTASPAVYTSPSYGARQQLVSSDSSAPLCKSEASRLRGIVGSILYYARAVDSTMLPAVTTLASLQARPTAAVMAQANRLLQYCFRYPSNRLILHACDMQLHVQSDASFNSRPRGRSVAGSFFYLGNHDHPEHINGAVHCISKVIDVVVGSVGEAEYAALYIAGVEATSLQQMLQSLGYMQSPTTMLCDNKFAVGLGSSSVKAKHSKAIDVKFYWIRDRVRRKQFNLVWREGKLNLADFFTKPLPVKVHQQLMPFFVDCSVVAHPSAAHIRHTAFLARRSTSTN